MLLKLAEVLQKNRNMEYMHRGIVSVNNDPKKLGRVKVIIPDMIEGSTSLLPWVAPLNPYFLGGKSNNGFFSVPDVGSEVAVIFPFRDIYFGFYVGYWISEASRTTKFDEDYPNSFGWTDKLGDLYRVNKKQGYVYFYHHSGTYYKIDKQGNITVYSKKKITVTAEDDITVYGKKNLDVTADGKTTLTTPSAEVYCDNIYIQGRTKETEITISGNVSITGNVSVQGNISAAGTIVDGGGNTNHHSHP